MRNSLKLLIFFVCIAVVILTPILGMAQGSDKALVRATVMDETGGSIPGAKVTMTNEATGVSTSLQVDQAGLAIFSTLPPAVYSVTVEVSGFKTAVQQHVELRVGQQMDLKFTLEVGTVTEKIVVEGTAPLMNTVSASLGTEIANQYINDMPLQNRSMNSLAYLAPGVTETTGTNKNDLGGAIFSSNGQRYGTAEFRLDGGLLTTPEGGEGGTTNVSYMPSVESIQEFKLQNNSFSAEYGSNGGTVVSVVSKSGTNALHGSTWYFGRRPALDANFFAANAAGDPKQAYAHDQFGVAIGGPIVKQKAFFFGNFERTRDNIPFSSTGTVPTALQRQGDFSQTYNGDGTMKVIYNPFNVVGGVRQPFPGNIIPAGSWDSIAANVMKLFPSPNLPGDPDTGANNYSFSSVLTSPSTQGDVKIDYVFNEKSRLNGRFNIKRNPRTTPSEFLNDDVTHLDAEGGTIEHNWMITPTTVWTNRIGATRFVYLQGPQNKVDPLSVGFPESLVHNAWYGSGRNAFPYLSFEEYDGLGSSGETVETDTQWLINSSISKTFGKHFLKAGGERRIFLNNFFQPANTSGEFDFSAAMTAANPLDPATDTEGSSLASFIVGFPGNSSGVGLLPAVANKSMETSFFIQDDWKLTPRLTLNLGLRYEWSTPYTERFNRNEFSCPECDSGVSVPALGEFPGKELFGTTILATADLRHSHADKNNFAPRFGFAYGLNDKTVIRGGGGIYYGMNYATNWQYGGVSWQSNVYMPMTHDSGLTRYASMENPYPNGFPMPQGDKYGDKALWGFDNFNHSSLWNRNAEIYQWNLGLQRQIGSSMLLEVNYSASRSVHLPWKRSPQSINNVPTSARTEYGTAGLNTMVENPFQYLFVQVPGMPAPLFNEPDSIYNLSTIPRMYIVRPYPQFGAYYTFPPFMATARYNALQVRFEKRYSHGLSFLGNYTYSKMWSTSDEGANRFYGRLSDGEPQDKNNLTSLAEGSVSANDTPHRLVLAGIIELPFGRGKKFGANMNRLADALVGGWRLNSFLTLQSGQPVSVRMRTNRLSGGQQRPNLDSTIAPCTGANMHDIIDGNANFFNEAAFSSPGDQIPGTAPRYIDGCRIQRIVNLDQGISKEFKIRDRMKVEVRGEFFNFFNHPRFGFPDVGYGGGSFGTIGSDQANEPRHGQFGVRFEF